MGATDRLTDDERRLLDEIVALLIPMGMTPIEARVQALLTISPTSLTLDEMMAKLKASKSSLSVATRVLERHGAVLRFSEPGTKRARYGIADRSAGILTAQVAFLADLGEVLRRHADSAPDFPTSSRLSALGDFYHRVSAALDAALKEDGVTAGHETTLSDGHEPSLT